MFDRSRSRKFSSIFHFWAGRSRHNRSNNNLFRGIRGHRSADVGFSDISRVFVNSGQNHEGTAEKIGEQREGRTRKSVVRCG